MLTDLLISKTRVKLLEIFLSDVTQMYHVRDLVRRAGEEINAVRRELAHLEKGGIVKKSHEEIGCIIGFVKIIHSIRIYFQ